MHNFSYENIIMLNKKELNRKISENEINMTKSIIGGAFLAKLIPTFYTFSRTLL